MGRGLVTAREIVAWAVLATAIACCHAADHCGPRLSGDPFVAIGALPERRP